jgi:hypothetical protein
MFFNLSIIVKTILCMYPHSSASAGRGFSQHSLNKTKLRNRLDLETCSSLLIVNNALKHFKPGTWEPPASLVNQVLKNKKNINEDD